MEELRSRDHLSIATLFSAKMRPNIYVLWSGDSPTRLEVPSKCPAAKENKLQIFLFNPTKVFQLSNFIFYINFYII